MKLFVIFILCMMATSLKAAVVATSVPAIKDASVSEMRKIAFQVALEKLVKQEMEQLGLDTSGYERSFEAKFNSWFSEIESRRRLELEGNEKMEEIIQLEKKKSRLSFSGWDKLLKSFTIRKFSQDTGTADSWEIILDATVDNRLLSIHFQRMLDSEKTFRKLIVLVNITTENFSWLDFGLEKVESFTDPIESEWHNWFTQNTPADVEEVVICDSACKEALAKWETQDEKNMKRFVDPELVGSLILKVNLSLSKDEVKSSFGELRMNYSGGIILQDLNTKRVLHWADLPVEYQSIRGGDQKTLNSAIASYCYKYPLSKFNEVKNQVGKSVSLTNSMTIKFINPTHLGQVMRLIEWIRVKGTAVQAQGKLDSFSQKEAKVLIFFRGSENKFKALVSAVSELESEWGRTLSVSDESSGLVMTLGEKVIQ